MLGGGVGRGSRGSDGAGLEQGGWLPGVTEEKRQGGEDGKARLNLTVGLEGGSGEEPGGEGGRGVGGGCLSNWRDQVCLRAEGKAGGTRIWETEQARGG